MTAVWPVHAIHVNHARTLTCTCDAAGELLVMDYMRVRVLYFQNPQFGFYLLRL